MVELKGGEGVDPGGEGEEGSTKGSPRSVVAAASRIRLRFCTSGSGGDMAAKGGGAGLGLKGYGLASGVSVILARFLPPATPVGEGGEVWAPEEEGALERVPRTMGVLKRVLRMEEALDRERVRETEGGRDPALLSVSQCL